MGYGRSRVLLRKENTLTAQLQDLAARRYLDRADSNGWSLPELPVFAVRAVRNDERVHIPEEDHPMLARIEDTLTSAFDLSFEQTVSRSLVHKKSLENVFLTDIKSCGDSWFVCGARMPAAHRFFNEGSRSPSDDILFYTEVGRQASVATSHAFFRVAHDQVFIFEQSEACLVERFWRSADHAGPSSVAVEIRIKEKETRKNGDVARVVAEHVIYNEREQVFRGTGAWSIQPVALFQRLRRRAVRDVAAVADSGPGPKMPPDQLGRELTENIVISVPERRGDGELVASLIIDRKHPFFFDHPCDHVPGMLLMEGCAQLSGVAAAQAGCLIASEGLVTSYQIEFTQFVELHLPVVMKARLNATERDSHGVLQSTARIEISQQDHFAGMADMSLAFDSFRSRSGGAYAAAQ